MNRVPKAIIENKPKNAHTREILRSILRLFKDPKNWCKGSMARRADGFRTNSTDPQACSWCLDGAVTVMSKAAKDTIGARRKVTDKLSKASTRLYHRSYISTNDQHQDGLSAVRRVIREAMKKS